MFESLFNQVVGLQVCNFIKKEIPTQVFSCEHWEIFINGYFEEITERKSVNAYFWIMSSEIIHPWRQHSQENTFTGVLFLINTAAIFIQKEVPAPMFCWQLSEIFSNNFLKSIVIRKKALL